MYEEKTTSFESEPDYMPFKVHMSGISYCDETYKIIRNNSTVCCIEYILKGKGYIKLDKTSFCAEKGDIYILPAGENHYYYSDADDPWTKIWFNISGRLVEDILKNYGIDRIYHIKGLDLSESFMRFYEVAKSEDDTMHIFNKCACIFLEIAQAAAEYINPKNNIEEAAISEILKKRLDEMADFSVPYEKIIKELYCTEHHAIRSFKAAYGITPYRYLLGRRLDAAKMLLKDSGMSIKEISDFVGFNDNHYFSAFFKRETGMSPTEYKNKSHAK